MQKELSARLSLSAGTVAWHVERLAGEGLVVKEEDGRTVRYYPSERLLDLTRRLAA
jgi:predicted transcriptional regulator